MQIIRTCMHGGYVLKMHEGVYVCSKVYLYVHRWIYNLYIHLYKSVLCNKVFNFMIMRD